MNNKRDSEVIISFDSSEREAQIYEEGSEIILKIPEDYLITAFIKCMQAVREEKKFRVFQDIVSRII